VKNTLDPVWQAFKIPVRALCNGDYDRAIKIEVYDWDRDGGHDYIGEFSTSYRELSKGHSQFTVWEVLNPKKKKKKKKYLNSGTKYFHSYLNAFLIHAFSALFTAGNPSQPTSLHYMSPYHLNAQDRACYFWCESQLSNVVFF
uniref:Copine-8-like n=1 Tax=Sinocyclocheilus rhinocerous TaxID=307959 RepID=A0A673GC15_9TELE